MADNITAPATGAVLATDDVSGVQYPRVKVSFGIDGAASDVSAANPFPVAFPAGFTTETTLAALSAKLPASVGVKAQSGSLSIVPATGTDLATSASIASVGTRSYGSPLTRLAYGAASVASAAISGTEVLVHNAGTARCFIRAGATPTATVNDIPLEAGEKFHLRITSGWSIAALQDTAAGNLNIVPVA